MDNYVQQLIMTNPLREPVIRSLIHDLDVRKGSRCLDVGCGIGLQALLLAEAVREKGHITGLDISPKFIEYAEELAANTDLEERVTFQQGDVKNLPFEKSIFDLALSIDCVGYHPSNPMPALSEMARVVRPGGTIAIVAYSSQQLLPGYPMLEARLNATPTGIAPFSSAMKPERHFLRALGWLEKLGLEQTEAKTYIQDFSAPLSDEIRDGLATLIDMRWGNTRSEAPEEIWAEYQRLCRPDSPDFILDLPNYYCFFTYSLFYGKVAE